MLTIIQQQVRGSLPNKKYIEAIPFNNKSDTYQLLQADDRKMPIDRVKNGMLAVRVGFVGGWELPN